MISFLTREPVADKPHWLTHPHTQQSRALFFRFLPSSLAGDQSRASHMLGKCSTTQLYQSLWPLFILVPAQIFFLIFFFLFAAQIYFSSPPLSLATLTNQTTILFLVSTISGIIFLLFILIARKEQGLLCLSYCCFPSAWHPEVHKKYFLESWLALSAC
jgi:hypothetical protein